MLHTLQGLLVLRAKKYTAHLELSASFFHKPLPPVFWSLADRLRGFFVHLLQRLFSSGWWPFAPALAFCNCPASCMVWHRNPSLPCGVSVCGGLGCEQQCAKWVWWLCRRLFGSNSFLCLALRVPRAQPCLDRDFVTRHADCQHNLVIAICHTYLLCV